MKTANIEAQCLTTGDTLLQFQNFTRDCHALFIKEVKAENSPRGHFVIIKSESGEVRRLPADFTVSILAGVAE